ncbi:MAG TPA: phenylalanine--tRNA ligase subunit alpha, partial [Blastocatellia bacterium]
MEQTLKNLRDQFFEDLKSVENGSGLASVRDKYLGRKSGLIAAEKKRVGTLSAEQRAEFGKQVNLLSSEVESELAKLTERFAADEETAALERERLDVTLPGTKPHRGHLHPITLVRQRLE